MVRVGSLIDQKLLDEDVRENKTYMTAEEQIDAVLRQVTRMMRSTNHIYDDLMDELERQRKRAASERHLYLPDTGRKCAAEFPGIFF